MENKKIPNPNDVDIHDKFNGACVTECTGLITVPPEDEAELESYRDIYEFGPPDAEELK